MFFYRDLLQRDPEFRPSAAEILLGKLPGLTVQYESHYYDDIEGMEEALLDRSKPKTGRPVRSILYYLKAYEGSISLTPVQLPPRSRIQQVAVSSTHIVVLTAEGLVFTWGEGKKGQLGHGELEPWRSKPLCVEALKAGLNILNRKRNDYRPKNLTIFDASLRSQKSNSLLFWKNIDPCLQGKSITRVGAGDGWEEWWWGGGAWRSP